MFGTDWGVSPGACALPRGAQGPSRPRDEFGHHVAGVVRRRSGSTSLNRSDHSLVHIRPPFVGHVVVPIKDFVHLVRRGRAVQQLLGKTFKWISVIDESGVYS